MTRTKPGSLLAFLDERYGGRPTGGKYADKARVILPILLDKEIYTRREVVGSKLEWKQIRCIENALIRYDQKIKKSSKRIMYAKRGEVQDAVRKIYGLMPIEVDNYVTEAGKILNRLRTEFKIAYPSRFMDESVKNGVIRSIAAALGKHNKDMRYIRQSEKAKSNDSRSRSHHPVLKKVELKNPVKKIGKKIELKKEPFKLKFISEGLSPVVDDAWAAILAKAEELETTIHLEDVAATARLNENAERIRILETRNASLEKQLTDIKAALSA